MIYVHIFEKSSERESQSWRKFDFLEQENDTKRIENTSIVPKRFSENGLLQWYRSESIQSIKIDESSSMTFMFLMYAK